MIKFTEGDILDDGSEVLVNTVNCVGVMGRGIALQFRNAFPTISKLMRRRVSAKKYSRVNYSSLRRGN